MAANSMSKVTGFNRNGFFYVIDRANGKLLSAEKFVDAVNWAPRFKQGVSPSMSDLLTSITQMTKPYRFKQGVSVGAGDE